MSNDDDVQMSRPRSRGAAAVPRHQVMRRAAGAIAAGAIGAGVLSGAIGASAAAAAAITTKALPPSFVSVTAAPRLPFGARLLGLVAPNTIVKAAVALRPRSQAAISAFIGQVSDPRSTLYHHYLSRGRYASRFGPTRAAVTAVRDQLVGDGLHVTSVSSNRLLVQFSGTASRVEAAFRTGLERVALEGGGTGRATTGAVRLPSTVGRYVQAVVGLDNLVHEANALMRAGAGHAAGHAAAPALRLSHSGSGGPVACSAALGQQAGGGLTDQQVAASYGLDPLYATGDLGAGQTVDIYELEPFSMADVQAFDQCYFGADGAGHTSNISVIAVDGGPGTGLGSGEAALDVEDVSAIAPDAKIHVFSGPNMDNSFGPLDTWNAIAVADDARQISSSWGLCETVLQAGAPGVQQVENDIFEQTAAQGQSVFAAAGDDGSDDCAGHASFPVPTYLSVDDPASQPYVTSVGGTTILDASTPPVETVWNNGADGGAGGGGISETWAMPTWQAGTYTQTAANEACSNDPSGTADDSHLSGDPTALPAGTECRQTPDVSALADPQSGITIVYGGTWYEIGGTSSSTPLWAAMTAEMNASSACRATPLGVGFIDPLLYMVGTGANASSAFNDITVGNNDNLGVGDGSMYTAGPGYDLASGLGTPRITNPDNEGLANQLCTLAAPSPTTMVPAVSGISPNAASTAGGTRVTISGSGFGTLQGSVFFGNVAATVTSWSPTSITARAPAMYSGPDAPPGEGESVVVTVTTALSPHQSSSPSSLSVFHYTGAAPGAGVPVVDYVASPAGPQAGGGTATIVGSGFTEAGGVESVTFGGVPATNLKVLGDDELSVTVPAMGSHTSCATATPGVCQVQVVVANADGPSATSPIEPAFAGPITFEPSGAFVPPAGCGCEVVQAPTEYDYAPQPTVTAVDPRFASETGGTTLAIDGSGFNLLDLYWVNIGPSSQNASQDFSLAGVTPTEIDEVAPGDPNFNGVATIEPDPSQLSVRTAGGLGTAPSFAFAGVPTVSGLSSHAGAQASPGSLTITGQGFSDANLVEFVGQGRLHFLASTTTRFTVSSDTSITVQVPQFFAMATDVLVCSETGCDSPNPSVDTYSFAYPGRPVLSSNSPSAGPEHGGTLVTIGGQLDSEVLSVKFGNLEGTVVSEPQLAPSGLLEVLAPASRRAGTVGITITTIGGALVGQPTSAPTQAATFTYQRSSPSAPQDLRVAPGKGSLSVSWSAPYTTGGYPVTGYVVTARAKGEKTVTRVTASRSAKLSGLVGHRQYTVVVVAENRLGRGVRATLGPVTPR